MSMAQPIAALRLIAHNYARNWTCGCQLRLGPDSVLGFSQFSGSVMQMSPQSRRRQFRIRVRASIAQMGLTISDFTQNGEVVRI